MIEETPLKDQDLVVTEVSQANIEKTGDKASVAVQDAETVEEANIQTPAEETPPTEAKTPAPSPKAKKKKSKRKPGAASDQKKQDKFYIPVEIGQKLTGKIKTITNFGAFVDLKLTVDGLVHISEMSRRRIEKVTDIISKGDEVEVWVKNVNRERGRVGLTMLKPLRYKYRDINEGDILDGQIKRIEDYGVFVDVGLEREGLVHVSELSHEYVKSPTEVVAVGDEVKVQVLKVDSRKKQVNLSVKTLLDPPESEVVEEDIVKGAPEEVLILEEEPMSTTMAAAFGNLASFRKPSRKKAPRRRRRNKTMDKVVARTLQVGQQD